MITISAAACAEATATSDAPAESPIVAKPEIPAVIFDTDMDFDDSAALAYLCAAHKSGLVSLRAVTVTNNGVGYPGKAIRHARCLLERCGLAKTVPVADGSASGSHEFPSAIRDGVNTGLERVTAACTASELPSHETAAELIERTVLASSKPVTLVTTGPLTNVAAALRTNPSLATHVKSAFMMGGAVVAGGNLCCGAPTGFDGTQEFNMWVDAASAKATFEALPAGAIHLVPLDATKDVPLSLTYVDRIKAEARTPEAQLVADITQDPAVKNDIPAGFLFWWDPLDVVALTNPEVITFSDQSLTIVTTGAQEGRTAVAAKGGARVRVATKADRTAFEETYLNGLNGDALTAP